MKKVYSSAFKAQVVLELLKEEKSLAQLSSDHGVHANVLRDWKATAVTNLASLFKRRDDVARAATQHQQQLDELYAEIGKLTTQVNWLKKSFQLKFGDTTAVGGTGEWRNAAVLASGIALTLSFQSLLSAKAAV